MKTDKGAQIGSGGCIIAPNGASLQFGRSDFTVAALFQTTHGGTVASKKSDGHGSPTDAGWLVVVRPDATIRFTTDNGIYFDEIESVATTAFDGQWHHVAAVRRGSQLSLYFDGKPLPAKPRRTAPGPHNVSGSAPLMIGDTQQLHEPRFAGVIEDVVLFSRALGQQELPACMFNLLTGSESGLAGLYRLNGNSQDDSRHRNHARLKGNVTYVPVYHCAWADGDNAFAYLSIASLDGVPKPGRRPQAPPAGPVGPVGPVGPAITRTQSLPVADGSPYMCVSICDDSGLLAFPVGATVTLRDPSGRVYNRDVRTQSLYVKTDGHGSPWVIVAAAPAAGQWTVTITAPAGVNFTFSMAAMPSKDLIGSIERAMAPILPPAAPDTGAGLALARATAAGVPWPWIGTVALGMAGAAFLVATSAVGAPAALFGFVAWVAVSGAASLILDFKAAAPTPPIAALQAAQYMAQGHNGGPRPLAAVVRAVRDQVGVPSTTDPARFASRADMGVDSSYHVHLDLGGEGYHEVDGDFSGFIDAINLNHKLTDSQPPYGWIPMLVQVPRFETAPQYPFVDEIADYITMQGAPLTERNTGEIARLLRVGGKAGLWIDRKAYQTEVDLLAKRFGCAPTYADVPGSGCTDEFSGKAPGFPKICLQRNQ
jgi:Concanavalin A-like lectin/glucanases superfamily